MMVTFFRKSVHVLFGLLAAVVFLSGVAAAGSRSYPPVVSTSHKQAPQSVSITNSRHRSPVVYLQDGDSIKRKPEAEVPASASDLRTKLTSRSAIIMDVESGDTIYAHAPDLEAQPASTIKILTGILSINYLDDKDHVKVSRRAAMMPSSKVYLVKGKAYRADDLINAVLLSSANDASVALAEGIAGSERVFAKLMTYKAKAWGANNTVCKTATGLTAHGQKSTVRDLAIIFEKAMEVPEFAARMAQSKAKMSTGKVLRNHNRALWMVDGAEGGKTGYTRAARQTYVGKFSRGDDSIVVAVMGSETMWDDISELVEYGFAIKGSGDSVASVSQDVSERLALSSPLQLLPEENPIKILKGSSKTSRL